MLSWGKDYCGACLRRSSSSDDDPGDRHPGPEARWLRLRPVSGPAPAPVPHSPDTDPDQWRASGENRGTDNTDTDSSHYAEWWRGPAIPANPGCQPTNTDKWQTSPVTREGERWKFVQFHNFLHSFDENKVKLFAENELCPFLVKS